MSYDGLKQIKARDLQMVYALPGASLASYTKVMLDPVTVKFAKNWDPTSPDFGQHMSQTDRNDIKTRLSKALLESFAKALKSKGGYEIVTAPGPDVLEVQATILNLKVTAPEALSSGMSRSWVQSAGQATLVAQLADAETGQVIVRAIDSSWCEVETDDEDVLDRVRRTFADVRVAS